jgi:Peptidase_C39 like family
MRDAGGDQASRERVTRRQQNQSSGSGATRKRRGARWTLPPPRDPNSHRAVLELQVLPQPNDTTCGPTCLHAVYNYWGDETSLSDVVSGVKPLPGGGTLAVYLAHHALRRGYKATIFTYNLQLFDPTWFLAGVDLREKLIAQREAKDDPKLRIATEPYLEFLDLGGKVYLGDKTSSLIRRFLKKGIPILTGLSANYLYRCAREIDDDYNDVLGYPLGHFVVLSGYDKLTKEVMVADPLHDNPGFGQQYYNVNVEQLIASIMLGIVTYDANLLILEPTVRPTKEPT